MRSTILKFAAAMAVITASAAPALACGGLFAGSGCAPCGGYVRPCGPGYDVGYGYAGTAAYQRLPDPARYYYADQGPTFSGPGNFAPYPTYQETAISGYRGYDRPNYGYYDGGPYGGATNHLSWAQPADRGPAIYTYQPRRYGVRPSYRYGYAPRGHVAYSGYQQRRFAGPRIIHAPRPATQQPVDYRGPDRRMY